ncbi:MAG: beta-propeller domain-containing protein [Nitrosopumilaceae archaeon]
MKGFSNYLHPYDENHIIGIGKETKENTYGVLVIMTQILTYFLILFSVQSKAIKDQDAYHLKCLNQCYCVKV